MYIQGNLAVVLRTGGPSGELTRTRFSVYPTDDWTPLDKLAWRADVATLRTGIPVRVQQSVASEDYYYLSVGNEPVRASTTHEETSRSIYMFELGVKLADTYEREEPETGD